MSQSDNEVGDGEIGDRAGKVYSTIDEYFEGRFLGQVKYYDGKSILNKRLYHGFQILVLILIAAIPSIGTILDTREQIVLFITIAALILLIAQGILSLYGFHEKWINYRTTTEALRREGELFKQQAGDYDEHENPTQLFVERVEELVSQEHRIWRVISRKAKDN